MNGLVPPRNPYYSLVYAVDNQASFAHPQGWFGEVVCVLMEQRLHLVIQAITCSVHVLNRRPVLTALRRPHGPDAAAAQYGGG